MFRDTLLLVPVIAARLIGGRFAIRHRVSTTTDQELRELTK
ncbi:hypothetical protein OOK36_38050 [Streptomyces sp. NBC_00365]|nr:hypothetical protein [Streptomyces sp. NBC_00365]MCX5094565.1 hypothetical protein [Streptomyces sp. NBC_00365]